MFVEQQRVEWGAYKTGEDREGNFHACYRAGKRIDQQHKNSSDQKSQRHGTGVVTATHEAAEVGDNQTDSANCAADGHCAGGEQAGADDHNGAHLAQVHSQRAGFKIAKGEDVDPPGQ